MGKSAAERKRLQRERLKEKGLYEGYAKKESEGKRNRRKLWKERATEEARETMRKKRAEEQRKYRFKKQQERRGIDKDDSAKQSHSPVYKSRSSLGKAIAKVKRALPRSPRKRSTVVRTLFGDVTPGIENKKRGRIAITAEVSDLVSQFYEKDSISYQAPGLKDYTIIRTQAGTKKKLQKRYLYFTIGEMFEEFKKEHPQIEIGLSKFSCLRPKHVMLRSQTPENLCLCLYHENVRLLLEAIPDFPKRTNEFVSTIVCDPQNRDCMLQTCGDCGNLKKFRDLQENLLSVLDVDENLTFRQWLKDDDKLVRAKQTASAQEVLTKLEDKCTYFLWHKYIQTKQACNFDTLKAKVTSSSIVIQIDFSENFTFKYQDEIQSAHWASRSCTVYCAVIYYRETPSDEVKVASYACISDYMMHDKYSVVVFNDAVLRDFKAHHPAIDVKVINYQSDGCGQHFKQKYMLCYITTIPDISVNWHFTATSHGKGAVDGVGGCLKRRLHESIKARQLDPSSIQELATYAAKMCPNISIVYVSAEMIERVKPELNKTWYIDKPNSIHNIPDTRKAHCFRSVQPYVLSVHTVSGDVEGFQINFKSGAISEIPPAQCLQEEAIEEKNSDDKLKPGNWILVQYLLSKGKKKKYIAQILTINNNEDIFHVKFLRYDRMSRKFFWPKVDDKADVDKNQVIKILPEPQFDKRLKLYFQGVSFDSDVV